MTRSMVADGVPGRFARRPGTALATAVERSARFHDWLTGLPNRAAFRLRLARALEAAAQGGPRVSVLVLHLDGFAEVGKEQGSGASTAVLGHVVRLLLTDVPPPCEVASFGEGEFAVLMADEAAETTLTSVAVHMVRALQAPLAEADRQARLRARIGITSTRPDHDVDTVLRNAYTALTLTRRD